jgi:hypothetical protein
VPLTAPELRVLLLHPAWGRLGEPERVLPWWEWRRSDQASVRPCRSERRKPWDHGAA